MVARCLEAADVLAAEGIDARVVDLRSLSPLDVPLLGTCARETGRVVVVHEAPRTLGMGAEIAARVMEEAFDHLEAPVARVTGWDVPYPPASLEQHYLPSVERIAEAVRTDGEVLMAERMFAMPDLGEGLEEGEIVEWLVAAGDDVTLNQPLVEVETAKATVEIPSPFAGRIASLHGAVGEAVPVGSPLVTFAVADGMDRPSLRSPRSRRGPRRRRAPPRRRSASSRRNAGSTSPRSPARVRAGGSRSRTCRRSPVGSAWRMSRSVEPITAGSPGDRRAADRGRRRSRR